MGSEIISRVERRRHWPDAEKARIMAEVLAPEAMVAAVADGKGLYRSQLCAWLRLGR